MKSVDLLKKELKARTDTTEIIDVMKKIAISQFHNLELIVKKTDKIEDLLKEFLLMVDTAGCNHSFITGSSASPAIVMITSDEGFVGGLNSQVIRKAVDLKHENNAELIVIGERGSGYMEDINETFSYFPGISEDVTDEEVSKIKDYLLHKYMCNEIGNIIFVYPKFVSFSHQEVRALQVLPCNHIFFVDPGKVDLPEGMDRRSGKERRSGKDRRAAEKGGRLKSDYSSPAINVTTGRRGGHDRRRKIYKNPKYKNIIVEPNADRVVDYLVGLWVKARIYEVAKESKLSEFAARAIHLEGGHQGFSRKNKQVKFQYQKRLHESVDKAIREVFASKLLWKDKKG